MDEYDSSPIKLGENWQNWEVVWICLTGIDVTDGEKKETEMRLEPLATANSSGVCLGYSCTTLPHRLYCLGRNLKMQLRAELGRKLPEHQGSIPKAQGNEVTVRSQGTVPPPQQQAILGGRLKPHEGI